MKLKYVNTVFTALFCSPEMTNQTHYDWSCLIKCFLVNCHVYNTLCFHFRRNWKRARTWTQQLLWRASVRAWARGAETRPGTSQTQEEIWMSGLWKGVLSQHPSATAPCDSFWEKTLQVLHMWERIHPEWKPQNTHESSQRSEATRGCFVFTKMLIKRIKWDTFSTGYITLVPSCLIAFYPFKWQMSYVDLILYSHYSFIMPRTVFFLLRYTAKNQKLSEMNVFVFSHRRTTKVDIS